MITEPLFLVFFIYYTIMINTIKTRRSKLITKTVLLNHTKIYSLIINLTYFNMKSFNQTVSPIIFIIVLFSKLMLLYCTHSNYQKCFAWIHKTVYFNNKLILMKNVFDQWAFLCSFLHCFKGRWRIFNQGVFAYYCLHFLNSYELYD